MTASAASLRATPGQPDARADTPRRITNIRAVFALVWAAGVFIAVGDRVPTVGSDVPIVAAVLLASYPLIDVIASLVAAARADTSSIVLRVNAAVSALAVAAIAVTAFGSDAGSTLVAFGSWAAVSGAIQFGVAVHRRRTQDHQIPMLISGALSTLAGVSFVASSGSHNPHLSNVSGYMALGAVLYLLSANRRHVTR
jgi:uncharacterized membrane protein HdeD (DUF308 family)